jgi:proton glutamate symport protein
MSLTLRVSIGLVAGLLLGLIISTSHAPWLMPVPAFFDAIGVVFVNAIRVAVIPLIVSSLIVGVAASGDDARKIGKLGGRALVLVLSILLAAAVFALAVASPLFARLNIDKSVVARLNESAAVRETAQVLPPSFAQWFTDLVPTNVFKAAADGALLPLIVVSVAFGLALIRVERQRRANVVQFFHGIADAFLVLVSYVVELAPVGVFALAVSLAARMGIGAAGALASYVAILSAVVAAFTVLILYPAAMLWGRVPLSRFAKAAAPAQAVAFASRSSLAALPAVYEGARAVLALPEDIYSFFLPLAASIFRVGGTMVQVVGVLFLAKLYGVVLNPWQLATVTVTAVATSLTVPGVPGGGIIVMAPVLTSVNLPAAGIGILLAVDTIPDMFRTAANVTGWLCAGTILSRGAAARLKESVAQSAVVAK